MKKVFADTYFFLALISPRDAAHRRALEYSEGECPALVTTAWVIAELADGLAATPNRHLPARILADLEENTHDTVVLATDDLFRKGLDLYDRRPDKTWSLTDCISFVVMGDRGITEALTGDRHFEQAGFRAIFASS